MLSAPKNRGKMIGLVYTGFSGANLFRYSIGTVIGDLTVTLLVLFLIIVDCVGCLMMIFFTEGSGNTTRPCES